MVAVNPGDRRPDWLRRRLRKPAAEQGEGVGASPTEIPGGSPADRISAKSRQAAKSDDENLCQGIRNTKGRAVLAAASTRRLGIKHRGKFNQTRGDCLDRAQNLVGRYRVIWPAGKQVDQVPAFRVQVADGFMELRSGAHDPRQVATVFLVSVAPVIAARVEQPRLQT